MSEQENHLEQQNVTKPRLKISNCFDAIIVKWAANQTYADIPKIMNAESTLQDLKGKVHGIRKTAKGEMILNMQKKSDSVTEQLHTALKTVFSNKAAVKEVFETVSIEVVNIDETTTADEVLLAQFASFEGDIPIEVALIM